MDRRCGCSTRLHKKVCICKSGITYKQEKWLVQCPKCKSYFIMLISWYEDGKDTRTSEYDHEYTSISAKSARLYAPNSI